MEWVLVHWLDITSCEHPWLTQEEATVLRPAEMWSAGHIVTQDKKVLVLAGTVDPSELSYGNVNAIPMGVVLSVRPLNHSAPAEGPDDAALRDAGLR